MQSKKTFATRAIAWALAFVMVFTMIPYGAFARGEEPTPAPTKETGAAAALPDNRKPKTNWDEEAGKGDERNWSVDIAGGQRLVRVRTTEPTQITDLNYDGTYTNADGRDVIKLLYKEKTQAISGVWYRMVLKFDSKLFNQIDWNASYGEGIDAKQYKFVDAKGKNEKWLDLGLMTGSKGNSRRNLPIHLVLKDGITIKALGEENYSVQMRLMDSKFERIYAMAPKGSSMDYTTYTKSTTIPLANDIDMAFYKGGKAQSYPYALQNGFFSSFVADPTEDEELSYIYNNYDNKEDLAKLAVLSTQYQAQRSTGDPKDEQEGKPAAYVQIFDAGFVDYLKPDKNGNIAYTNVLNWSRKTIANTKVGIKKDQINYKKDENGNNKFAYVVLASSKFNNTNVKKVVRVHNDNFWKILNEQNGYITTVDYMVDKSKFADTFKSSGKHKVDFPIMSGWVDSNPNGWAVYERTFDKDMVLPKGYKSPIVDTGVDVKNDGVLFQVGDPNDALVRRPQGYYNGLAAGTGGLDQITKEGVTGQYSYTLREGATIKKGDKVRVLLQDYGKENVSVNFYNLETGTERDQSKPVLSLGEEGLGKNKRRILTTHIYKDFKNDRGYYKVRYTPVGKTEEKTFEFKIVDTLVGVKWEVTDKNMITGTPNYAVTASEGNFKIDLGKVEPGTNLIIESYNSKGELQDGETASMTFEKFERVDNYTDLAWLDLMDNMSLLTLKKSLYRPYQEMFTNDYAMSEEGLKDNQKINQIYRDPRSLPKTEDAFKHDTASVQGFTRYDGGTLRLLYVDKDGNRYVAKANAAENEYDKDGNITTDATKEVTVYDKKYNAFPYEVFLKQFNPTRNAPVLGETFKLYKDMRFLANTSDGSSVPSDWLENRVKARVLFNATEGAFEEDKKQDVRIVPDNVKFYEEDGYKANGFTGANVAAGTGDEFPANPTATGKTFLGWVTEAGKTALGNKTVTTAAEFEKLAAENKFTETTPVERHLVVYAVWTEEQLSQADTIDPKVPADKTPVANKKNLTQEEKDAVKKAIEDANKDGEGNSTLPAGTEITVGDDGTATITYPDKSKDTIAGDKLVEEKAKTQADTIDPKVPKDKTPVADKKNLTQEEKDAVKKAIEDANKDDQGKSTLPDGTTITVGDDGTATITYPDKSKDTIAGDKLVEEKAKTQADTIDPKVPKDKTPVANKKNLTQEEKDAVKKAIEDANKDDQGKSTLPDGTTITVGDDGTATITYPDKSKDTIAGDKLVEDGSSTPQPGDKKTSVDSSNVKPVNPTNDSQDTGIVVTNPDKDTKVSAKDEDGKYVPAEIDSRGNVFVTPGKDVDGPITVTIQDSDLPYGRKVIEVPVVGHKANRDDNGSNSGNSHWFVPVNPGWSSADNKVDTKDQKHETAIHKAYIYGYENGSFKPEGNMTRAEAAAMLARLQGLDLSNSARPNFIDVRSGWYNAAINAVVNAGYMKGYPDGTFRPNGKITRAEFAQMIKAIDKANTGMAPFADAKGHWAEAAINQAYANGRINGYPDGTFRPNNHITRAEAVKVFNKLYDRSVNLTGLRDVLTNIVPFVDVNASHWAYYEIVEASNTHTFYRTEKGQVPETWVMLNQTWKQASANR
ncbi:S-layer homology domain-containing protein [Aedoeadaptatus acetigenes]|uniref:S-layer homology domain-containing protein n=1 Tax=Aedoeadaptatus acetigenes TaxID=2981723 RepID=UPI002265A910|nr:S-layer homology domain-containing protein [Aedoeadaptatus acetigenes]MCU6786254.1 S-layer homology domain-containing protein [Aedoeadaptatus acetigenes]